MADKSKKKSSLKIWLTKLGISLGIAVVVILLTQDFILHLGLFTRFELTTIDYRFRQRGAKDIKNSSDVVIIDIDQHSFEALPDKYPWPRSYYAHLVRNLKRAGAKAIGLDLIFDQADPHGPQEDEELRKAIKEAGNVVVGGKVEEISKSYTIKREKENFSTIFFDADSSVGIVQIRNDEDGIYRRYRPFAATERGMRIPSFSFAVLNKVFLLPQFYTAELRPGYFQYKDIDIPRYDFAHLLINFYGPNETFRHLHFADVIDDASFKTVDELNYGVDINTFDDPESGYLHEGTFTDKIVLIGSTNPEDQDLRAVPLSKTDNPDDNLMYGVELHANVIQDILERNFLTKSSSVFDFGLIFFICVLTFFATSQLKEIKIRLHFLLEIGALVLVAGELLLIVFSSNYFFIRHNLLLSMVSPSIGVMSSYIGSAVYHYLVERKQKTMIKGMFSQYVNPSVVNELIEHPEKLRLGGERKELTVMFTDIAGFTSISESMQPENLVSVLNEYLSEMTAIIFKYDGTLDKYEGDAIMAFWGAPIPQDDHAFRACMVALEQQERLVTLREKWKAEQKPDIHMRAGVNTGEMVVGNMGGVGRFDYTVIGDSVNLGSRLEGANKQYNTKIMVSEITYKHVKDKMIARELDLIAVKGKTLPVKTYELVGLMNDRVPSEKLQVIEIYRKGLEYYRKRDFKTAIEHFEKALSIDPNDYPSKLYIERSTIFQISPPPDNWDGVFVMKTK